MIVIDEMECEMKVVDSVQVEWQCKDMKWSCCLVAGTKVCNAGFKCNKLKFGTRTVMKTFVYLVMFSIWMVYEVVKQLGIGSGFFS